MTVEWLPALVAAATVTACGWFQFDGVKVSAWPSDTVVPAVTGALLSPSLAASPARRGAADSLMLEPGPQAHLTALADRPTVRESSRKAPSHPGRLPSD